MHEPKMWTLELGRSVRSTSEARATVANRASTSSSVSRSWSERFTMSLCSVATLRGGRCTRRGEVALKNRGRAAKNLVARITRARVTPQG